MQALTWSKVRRSTWEIIRLWSPSWSLKITFTSPGFSLNIPIWTHLGNAMLRDEVSAQVRLSPLPPRDLSHWWPLPWLHPVAELHHSVVSGSATQLDSEIYPSWVKSKVKSDDISGSLCILTYFDTLLRSPEWRWKGQRLVRPNVQDPGWHVRELQVSGAAGGVGWDSEQEGDLLLRGAGHRPVPRGSVLLAAGRAPAMAWPRCHQAWPHPRPGERWAAGGQGGHWGGRCQQT